MSFLKATDLHVKVDGFALRDISFELPRGECLSVVGPSGAGKSLLLNAMAGFHTIAGGRLALDGRDISAALPERRGIGIVYQDNALFPHLSVFENIAYGLRARERNRQVVQDQVEEMAEAFGLQGLLDKRPAAISGGEQQRTALARALAVRPRLLLMDESFSSLDPPLRRSLRKTVRSLIMGNSITVIHAAHDLDDVYALADRIMVIVQGRVEAFGRTNAVFGPPATAFLRRVEGVRVILGTVKERRNGVSLLDVGDVPLVTADPAEPGEEVRLILRPEDVTLHTTKPSGASARNMIDSRVTGIHRLGETDLVALQSGGVEFNALLTPAAVEGLSVEVGKRIFATIKAVHLKIG